MTSTIIKTRHAVSLAQLYLVRGTVAIAWAVGFAAVSHSLTAAAGSLLVVYPLIDVVATLGDLRRGAGKGLRRLMSFNVAVSALAAVGLGIAATGTIADVLRAFGAWAVISGLAQLIVAINRRALLGRQWPMFIAGGLSVLVGFYYFLAAADAHPKLNPLATYAAAGGAFFVAQAAILMRRNRRSRESAGRRAERWSSGQPHDRHVETTED